jgi:hypothetical protein
MVSAGFVSLTLALALGQAPSAEAAWMKALPADLDIAIHLRGLGTVKSDLASMIKGMSPTAEQSLVPQLDQGLQAIRKQISEQVLPPDSPIVALVRLPKPGEDPGPKGPPFLTVAAIKDYPALQKSGFGLQNIKSKKESGGYDTNTGMDNAGNEQTVYSYKGNGFAAVSNDEDLIKAVAKPSGGKTLDSKLSGEVAARFFGGDIGLYVDLATIQERYGEQIDALRQNIPGVAQGLGQQGGGDPAALQAQMDALFQGLKNAKALAFNFDFASDGLKLSGVATVKDDSGVAKARTGTGEMLTRMPDDASFYVYTNASVDTIEKLARSNFQTMMGAGAKDSPDLKKGFDLQREAGVQDTAMAMSMGQGTRQVLLVAATDPKKFVEGITTLSKAQKPSSGGEGVVKDVTITPNAETYKQLRLNRATVTLDLAKLAEKVPNNQGGAEALRKMLGGDTTNTWYGTDGKRVVSATAKDWDQARAMIDQVLGSGGGGLGASASYKAIRSKLPAKVGTLLLVSAQGALQAAAANLGAMTGRPAEVPGDVPKAPAYFGGALTRSAGGYTFEFLVPREVGPVIEKGFLPVFSTLQGGANQ